MRNLEKEAYVDLLSELLTDYNYLVFWYTKLARTNSTDIAII